MDREDVEAMKKRSSHVVHECLTPQRIDTEKQDQVTAVLHGAASFAQHADTELLWRGCSVGWLRNSVEHSRRAALHA